MALTRLGVKAITTLPEITYNNLVAKGDGSSNAGHLTLNCEQNSHAVKIKAPPHSASQSYTLTLPSSLTNNQF